MLVLLLAGVLRGSPWNVRENPWKVRRSPWSVRGYPWTWPWNAGEVRGHSRGAPPKMQIIIMCISPQSPLIMFYLSSSTTTCAFLLDQLRYSALTPAHYRCIVYTFCPSHYIFPAFLFCRTTGTNREVKRRKPDHVQSTPEAAASLPSAGCPQVRLFNCTLCQKQCLQLRIVAYPAVCTSCTLAVRMHVVSTAVIALRSTE